MLRVRLFQKTFDLVIGGDYHLGISAFIVFNIFKQTRFISEIGIMNDKFIFLRVDSWSKVRARIFLA